MKCQECGFENEKMVNACGRCGARIYGVPDSKKRSSLFASIGNIMLWLFAAGAIIMLLWMLIRFWQLGIL